MYCYYFFTVTTVTITPAIAIPIPITTTVAFTITIWLLPCAVTMFVSVKKVHNCITRFASKPSLKSYNISYF